VHTLLPGVPVGRAALAADADLSPLIEAVVVDNLPMDATEWHALEAARADRLALPARPWDDWGALLVCRDTFPRRHEGAGRCIHRHIDPGAAPALKAAAAAAEAAARGPGAVADAMAAAAAAADATRHAPSLLAALHGSLGVEAQVRYVHTPELRFFLIKAAKAIETHWLELRWTQSIRSVGEQAVMSGTWMARQLLPTLEVPPPKRPRAPSPRGRRPGAAGAPFEGFEEIEYRPISLLYALLVPHSDASDAPLFARGRKLDPVEERGPDGDGRAAFVHGDSAQAAQDQGARPRAAMCTAEPCDEFVTVAPLLFLRYWWPRCSSSGTDLEARRRPRRAPWARAGRGTHLRGVGCARAGCARGSVSRARIGVVCATRGCARHAARAWCARHAAQV